MAELTYTQHGDYLYPDLCLTETTRSITKYGMLRKRYLEEHRLGYFNYLLLTEQLWPHLLEIEDAAEERLEIMMKELTAKDPPPDKATDQMGWVQHMNCLKAQAEEVIYAELIYS